MFGSTRFERKVAGKTEYRTIKLENGAIVDANFRHKRFITYPAVDGTYRLGRVGKPFKVAPMPMIKQSKGGKKVAWTPIICQR